MSGFEQRPPESREPENEIYRQGGQNSRNGFTRTFFLLLALAAVIALAAWGWHSGWGVSKVHAAALKTKPVATTSVSQGPPVMEVRTLLRSNMAALVGKKIRLHDVLVEHANDQSSILIGPQKSKEMLVAVEKGAVPGTLRGGQLRLERDMVANVIATVEKAPGSLVEMRRDWKLSPAEAELVKNEGYYLKGSRIVPQSF